MGMHQMLGPISGSGDPDPIDVTRSLRFTSGDSAYLSRTPSSAGNRRTWTWSGWIKRTKLGSEQALFNAWTDNSNRTIVRFNSSDQFQFLYQNGGTFYGVTTTQVFRDVGAWLHLVIAMDTTKSTSTDRVKVYVNGSQIADANLSSFSSGKYPPQNTEYQINSTTAHHIGARKESGSFTNTYLDAYLANIQFIDGEALQPSKFGVLNDDNVWVPAEYSDSYGTNGFYLQFNSTTTSALGDDTSGNNNDYTPNNLTGTDAKLFIDKKPDGSNWGNISNAFDGNTSTYADGTYNNGTTSTITFNPPITGVTSLRVYWYGTSNYGYNGSNVGSGSTTAEYKSVYSGSAITVNSIQGTSQPGNGVVRLYAIEVNGSVLTGYSRGTPTVVDSMFDSPTNGSQTDTGAGGEVSGNYATLNTLATGSSITLSNGNLDAVSSSHSTSHATIAVTAGLKVYMEFTRTGGTSAGGVGFTSNPPYSVYPGQQSNLWWVYDNGINFVYSYNGSYTQYGPKIGTNDCVQLAIDYDAGKGYIGINNTWFTTSNGTNGNPATGANPTFTFSTSLPLFPFVECAGFSFAANFGQRQFSYTAPSGFKALCTANLPTPSIAEGADYFDAKIWTGNSSSTKLTTGFSPDFVWLKSRSSAFSHYLGDIVRGNTKLLQANSTAAEITSTTGITSFDSDGVTLGNGSETNLNNDSMVAWIWDAGSSTVSNYDGSITSSVRANASAGFSIVAYTGTGTAGTIGHGLNAAPSLVIAKSRSATGRWTVYSSATGAGNKLYLDGTDSSAGSSNWNSTAPTSSVFSVGGSVETNTSTVTYVAYCFSPVSQYSAMGSYTGNGSADGPFVHTGFRPKWLLIKKYNSGANNWYILDTERDTYNAAVNDLYADLSNAENSFTGATFDILSNGFKVRTTEGSINSNGASVLYAAFAEHPFKTARAR